MTAMRIVSGPSAASTGGLIAPAGGDPRWWFGTLATIKVDGAATNGRLSLVELLVPPGYEVPAHVHRREDEIFSILEGELRFSVGGAECTATPGATVLVPRGTPHRFASTRKTATRYLVTYGPAGFEGFMRDTSVVAPAPELPPMDLAPPGDPSTFDALMLERYGTEWVGGA